MNALLTLSPLLAPLALIAAAVLARRDKSPRPLLALRATRVATLVALILALATAVVAVLRGPLTSPLLGFDGLGFSLRLDGLSAVMFLLVATLAALVVQFSRNYLAGDPRQGIFLSDLALTAANVMILVLSGNLVQLVLSWIGTSIALHRLLLFYRDRQGAVIAARKKFLVARLGDAALVLAAALLIHHFGSGDLAEVLAGAANLAATGELPLSLHLATALIGLAAILKTAQFPAHGWLIEMQETPTPVSALLHAGILNGGVFLVARLAAVVQLSTPVLAGLVVVGGFTAIFASVVMVTDSRIKVTLAYSSAAHMGFMLLLCGIGAYPVAIAHLVAHSFYKAHAFLSSGSAVDTARAAWTPGRGKLIPLGRVLGAYAATALIVWGVASLLGFAVFATPTSAGLAWIMTLALSHLMAQGAGARISAPVVAQITLAVAATALSFYLLEHAGEALFAAALPAANVPGTAFQALIACVIAAFALVTLLQLRLPGLEASAAAATAAAAYVHVRNGLYANSYFDRLTGAMKSAMAPRTAVVAPQAVSREQEGPAGAKEDISSDVVQAAIKRATHAVAPVWPLDSFVAVNPFVGLADRTLPEAAHLVARTAGARMTMPRSFYAEALAAGRFGESHLAEAIADARARGAAKLPDAATLMKKLREEAGRPETAELPPLVPTVADVVTQLSGTDWNRILVERIGAWAASYFDEGQASWRSPWKESGPYAAFRAEASLDRTPEIFGARHFRAILRQLPAEPALAQRAALERLGIPAAALDLYLQRLLAGIGGWSAFARHRVWQSELSGRRDATLEEVLAIRLAWEVALLEAFAPIGAEESWRATRGAIADAHDEKSSSLATDLVLQAAYERAWQEELFAKLAAGAAPEPARQAERPLAQAAFCIDVRSEVFRRALEEVEPACETLGFAGFFGFPIEYVPLGHEKGSAQCPVLLTPKGIVVESVCGATGDASARVARTRLLSRQVRNAWSSFKSSAIACFGFVGPVGLAYLPKLVANTFGWTRTVPHPSRDGVASQIELGPEVSLHTRHGRRVGLGREEQLAMAEGLLRGMSLTSGFARLVLLAGHGSTTVNNPHAAGLDCGACGGHTGEANARIAALVLNDEAIRRGLAAKGIEIPTDTLFLGCLHDTTTDLFTVFDRHLVPPSHAADLARLDARLAAAGALARRRRAPLLGEQSTDPQVDRQILQRSRDWAQVRPEWGLAGCASFIVAPRRRTAGLDLGGRAFLHSYDWREDERHGFPVLELVMTAPMVVGSWINLQYYASTVDNRVYGSGNKVLHNVVGTLGVLEGNGGDLRVGLPWQSLHDGEKLVHEPLRLSVLIEAPIEAMNAILEKHPSVRALVDNGWLHLFALKSAVERGEKGAAVTHRYAGGLEWQPILPNQEELVA